MCRRVGGAKPWVSDDIHTPPSGAVHRVGSQEVGLSGAIKWTASNGPLPDASDKSDQHAVYSLQEQDALKKLFNLTAVRLWMPAGVHQRVDLARDIESGIIFAELQYLKMIIALVRSYDSASLSQHTVE